MCVVSSEYINALLEGVVMGIGIGAIVAITIIWVPLINSLRKKMNGLISEIGIKR